MDVKELPPPALARALAGPEPPLVLDVRDDWEWTLGRVEGSVHIPLGELVQRVGELDPQRPTVVLCHHGVRSFQAALWLARRGFVQVANLAGGIDAWSREVDPKVAVY
jgi:sulfur-carrier protein adenylyltransferase/sulfurtransferase